MANYLVGDVHGCIAELEALLEKVSFNAKEDHLYLTGDLVARGADSLAVLRLIKNLGSHAHTVLGNHDLHLLAVAAGFFKSKAKDNTLAILAADDRDELLDWLRAQPLLIHAAIANDKANGFVLTHAGIAPAWDLPLAKALALEVEQILQSDDYLWLIEHMYGDEPKQWSSALTGIARYRFIINAFTRMRFCDKSGALDLQNKDEPEQIEHLLPWFNVSNRKPITETLIFGHWAALNGYIEKAIIGLDTGCVWGGELTMLRWEDYSFFRQKNL